MANTEEYFPRGGKKPKVPYYKQSDNFLGGVEREQKKKFKKKSVNDDGNNGSDNEEQTFNQSQRNYAYGLNLQIVNEGMLMLGRVFKVQDTKILISLPFRMLGAVMACYISEEYNKQLDDYINDKVEKVRELMQMFQAGQYVAVKVLENENGRLMLSTMPQHINSGRTHRDLYKGALFQGAVSSIEDHGYVVDLGIPNTRAFLAKENVNPEIELDIGVVTWCSVKTVSTSADNSIITLTNQLEALQKTLQRRSNNAPLLPGTGVDFVVHRPLENAIEGHIFGDKLAYIPRQYADSVNGKKPAIGQKVRARILYVMPTRNTPYLTMKNVFEKTYADLKKEQKFNDGDIIEEALVLKITGRLVYFKLAKGSTGVLGVRRLQVHEDLSDEEIISKSYPIGSTHRVRVMYYNLSDFLYSVSDEPHILEERYFSWNDVAVGDIVDAKVQSIADRHMVLTVGRIRGLVTHAHFTDTGVVFDPKKRAISALHKKKYKEGQDVKARVLMLDSDKQQVLLTLKPTLLAPDFEVLQSYEQAVVGKSYYGIIKFIKNYLLVSFFNGVKAIVPHKWVSRQPPPDLMSIFHIGQIVKCTIIKVHVEEKKMTGSLITEPFSNDVKSRINEKRKQDTTNSEVPNKKRKSDDVQVEEKEKKKVKKISDDSEEETHDDTENKTTKKERKNMKKIIEKETENGEQSDMNLQNEIDGNEEKDIKKEKKKKKRKLEIDEEETDSKEYKKKKDRKESVTEDENDEIKEELDESDPIDTDNYEDDIQVLRPQDLQLIDLSDCVTYKKCKKRVVSLLKAVNARASRIDRIEKKILKIEQKGLHPRNKKFHTAMHLDRLTVQKGIKKLLDALKLAQQKLQEFGVEDENKREDEDNHKKNKNKKRDATKKDKTQASENKMETKKEELKDVPEETRNIQDIKVLDVLVPTLEVPSAKEFWSTNSESENKEEENESSSSEDEEKEVTKKRRKKLTVAEKIAKAREEEERIREMEKRAVEGSTQPRSADQFERALLARPDCSQLWIAYMAFHLQATEIEKARTIGRKALNTISFREEQEKLNVWLAMINFENRFGTKESQQSTLEEALRMNDPFKIHSKLLDIYVETGKLQELSSLVYLMLGKYKRDPSTYIMCGDACYKVGLVDKARHVMQKAIAFLDKKEHVPVLVQFARMERAQGAAERAEALFEHVLAAYPHRVDVCSAYVDTLLKDRDVERVRQVMERMTSQKLPARKMKVLFNKWIEAEEKIGDKEYVEKIQQRAEDYIKKAQF